MIDYKSKEQLQGKSIKFMTYCVDPVGKEWCSYARIVLENGEECIYYGGESDTAGKALDIIMKLVKELNLKVVTNA